MAEGYVIYHHEHLPPPPTSPRNPLCGRTPPPPRGRGVGDFSTKACKTRGAVCWSSQNILLGVLGQEGSTNTRTIFVVTGYLEKTILKNTREKGTTLNKYEAKENNRERDMT